jgi:hypothetical protein
MNGDSRDQPGHRPVVALTTTDTESLARDLHAAELGYLARGWPVFHLLPRSKEPFPGSRGFKDATLERAKVEAVRRYCPKANIGIPTGKASGLYVVDLDPGKDGFHTWARIEARYGCALTLEAETGSGGVHLVYTYPQVSGPKDGTWPNTRDRLGRGVDTRGEGGYIVAAPSIHPNGRPYRWCEASSDPSPMTDWLLELLDDEPPAPRVVAPIVPSGDRRDRYWLAALQGEVEQLLAHPAGVPGGKGRNWRLHQAACRIGRLEAHGARLDVAEAALVDAAVAVGLREADARRQIRNGFTWGRRNPRGGAA